VVLSASNLIIIYILVTASVYCTYMYSPVFRRLRKFAKYAKFDEQWWLTQDFFIVLYFWYSPATSLSKQRATYKWHLFQTGRNKELFDVVTPSGVQLRTGYQNSAAPVRLTSPHQLGVCVVGKKFNCSFQFGFGFTTLTAVSVFSVLFLHCVLFNTYALYWVLSRSLFYHCFGEKEGSGTDGNEKSFIYTSTVWH